MSTKNKFLRSVENLASKPLNIDSMVCYICSLVVWNPNKCLTCNSMFCSQCIHSYLQIHKTCLCGNFFIVIPCDDIEEEMKRLIFICPSRDCGKLIPYLKTQVHQRDCKYGNFNLNQSLSELRKSACKKSPGSIIVIPKTTRNSPYFMISPQVNSFSPSLDKSFNPNASPIKNNFLTPMVNHRATQSFMGGYYPPPSPENEKVNSNLYKKTFKFPERSGIDSSLKEDADVHNRSVNYDDISNKSSADIKPNNGNLNKSTFEPRKSVEKPKSELNRSMLIENKSPIGNKKTKQKTRAQIEEELYSELAEALSEIVRNKNNRLLSVPQKGHQKGASAMKKKDIHIQIPSDTPAPIIVPIVTPQDEKKEDELDNGKSNGSFLGDIPEIRVDLLDNDDIPEDIFKIPSIKENKNEKANPDDLFPQFHKNDLITIGKSNELSGDDVKEIKEDTDLNKSDSFSFNMDDAKEGKQEINLNLPLISPINLDKRDDIIPLKNDRVDNLEKEHNAGGIENNDNQEKVIKNQIVNQDNPRNPSHRNEENNSEDAKPPSIIVDNNNPIQENEEGLNEEGGNLKKSKQPAEKGNKINDDKIIIKEEQNNGKPEEKPQISEQKKEQALNTDTSKELPPKEEKIIPSCSPNDSNKEQKEDNKIAEVIKSQKNEEAEKKKETISPKQKVDDAKMDNIQIDSQQIKQKETDRDSHSPNVNSAIGNETKEPNIIPTLSKLSKTESPKELVKNVNTEESKKVIPIHDNKTENQNIIEKTPQAENTKQSIVPIKSDIIPEVVQPKHESQREILSNKKQEDIKINNPNIESETKADQLNSSLNTKDSKVNQPIVESKDKENKDDAEKQKDSNPLSNNSTKKQEEEDKLKEIPKMESKVKEDPCELNKEINSDLNQNVIEKQEEVKENKNSEPLPIVPGKEEIKAMTDPITIKCDITPQQKNIQIEAVINETEKREDKIIMPPLEEEKKNVVEVVENEPHHIESETKGAQLNSSPDTKDDKANQPIVESNDIYNKENDKKQKDSNPLSINSTKKQEEDILKEIPKTESKVKENSCEVNNETNNNLNQNVIEKQEVVKENKNTEPIPNILGKEGIKANPDPITIKCDIMPQPKNVQIDAALNEIEKREDKIITTPLEEEKKKVVEVVESEPHHIESETKSAQLNSSPDTKDDMANQPIIESKDKDNKEDAEKHKESNPLSNNSTIKQEEDKLKEIPIIESKVKENPSGENNEINNDLNQNKIEKQVEVQENKNSKPIPIVLGKEEIKALPAPITIKSDIPPQPKNIPIESVVKEIEKREDKNIITPLEEEKKKVVEVSENESPHIESETKVAQFNSSPDTKDDKANQPIVESNGKNNKEDAEKQKDNSPLSNNSPKKQEEEDKLKEIPKIESNVKENPFGANKEINNDLNQNVIEKQEEVKENKNSEPLPIVPGKEEIKAIPDPIMIKSDITPQPINKPIEAEVIEIEKREDKNMMTPLKEEKEKVAEVVENEAPHIKSETKGAQLNSSHSTKDDQANQPLVESNGKDNKEDNEKQKDSSLLSNKSSKKQEEDKLKEISIIESKVKENQFGENKEINNDLNQNKIEKQAEFQENKNSEPTPNITCKEEIKALPAPIIIKSDITPQPKNIQIEAALNEIEKREDRNIMTPLEEEKKKVAEVVENELPRINYPNIEPEAKGTKLNSSPNTKDIKANQPIVKSNDKDNKEEAEKQKDSSPLSNNSPKKQEEDELKEIPIIESIVKENQFGENNEINNDLNQNIKEKQEEVKENKNSKSIPIVSSKEEIKAIHDPIIIKCDIVPQPKNIQIEATLNETEKRQDKIITIPLEEEKKKVVDVVESEPHHINTSNIESGTKAAQLNSSPNTKNSQPIEESNYQENKEDVEKQKDISPLSNNSQKKQEEDILKEIPKIESKVEESPFGINNDINNNLIQNTIEKQEVKDNKNIETIPIVSCNKEIKPMPDPIAIKSEERTDIMPQQKNIPITTVVNETEKRENKNIVAPLEEEKKNVVVEFDNEPPQIIQQIAESKENTEKNPSQNIENLADSNKDEKLGLLSNDGIQNLSEPNTKILEKENAHPQVEEKKEEQKVNHSDIKEDPKSIPGNSIEPNKDDSKIKEDSTGHKANNPENNIIIQNVDDNSKRKEEKEFKEESELTRTLVKEPNVKDSKIDYDIQIKKEEEINFPIQQNVQVEDKLGTKNDIKKDNDILSPAKEENTTKIENISKINQDASVHEANNPENNSVIQGVDVNLKRKEEFKEDSESKKTLTKEPNVKDSKIECDIPIKKEEEIKIPLQENIQETLEIKSEFKKDNDILNRAKEENITKIENISINQQVNDAVKSPKSHVINANPTAAQEISIHDNVPSEKRENSEKPKSNLEETLTNNEENKQDVCRIIAENPESNNLIKIDEQNLKETPKKDNESIDILIKEPTAQNNPNNLENKSKDSINPISLLLEKVKQDKDQPEQKREADINTIKEKNLDNGVDKDSNKQIITSNTKQDSIHSNKDDKEVGKSIDQGDLPKNCEIIDDKKLINLEEPSLKETPKKDPESEVTSIKELTAQNNPNKPENKSEEIINPTSLLLEKVKQEKDQQESEQKLQSEACINTKKEIISNNEVEKDNNIQIITSNSNQDSIHSSKDEVKKEVKVINQADLPKISEIVDDKNLVKTEDNIEDDEINENKSKKKKEQDIESSNQIIDGHLNKGIISEIRVEKIINIEEKVINNQIKTSNSNQENEEVRKSINQADLPKNCEINVNKDLVKTDTNIEDDKINDKKPCQIKEQDKESRSQTTDEQLNKGCNSEIEKEKFKNLEEKDKKNQIIASNSNQENEEVGKSINQADLPKNSEIVDNRNLVKTDSNIEDDEINENKSFKKKEPEIEPSNQNIAEQLNKGINSEIEKEKLINLEEKDINNQIITSNSNQVDEEVGKRINQANLPKNCELIDDKNLAKTDDNIEDDEINENKSYKRKEQEVEPNNLMIDEQLNKGINNEAEKEKLKNFGEKESSNPKQTDKLKQNEPVLENIPQEDNEKTKELIINDNEVIPNQNFPDDLSKKPEEAKIINKQEEKNNIENTQDIKIKIQETNSEILNNEDQSLYIAQTKDKSLINQVIHNEEKVAADAITIIEPIPSNSIKGEIQEAKIDSNLKEKERTYNDAKLTLNCDTLPTISLIFKEKEIPLLIKSNIENKVIEDKNEERNSKELSKEELKQVEIMKIANPSSLSILPKNKNMARSSAKGIIIDEIAESNINIINKDKIELNISGKEKDKQDTSELKGKITVKENVISLEICEQNKKETESGKQCETNFNKINQALAIQDNKDKEATLLWQTESNTTLNEVDSKASSSKNQESKEPQIIIAEDINLKNSIKETQVGNNDKVRKEHKQPNLHDIQADKSNSLPEKNDDGVVEGDLKGKISMSKEFEKSEGYINDEKLKNIQSKPEEIKIFYSESLPSGLEKELLRPNLNTKLGDNIVRSSESDNKDFEKMREVENKLGSNESPSTSESRNDAKIRLSPSPYSNETKDISPPQRFNKKFLDVKKVKEKEELVNVINVIPLINLMKDDTNVILPKQTFSSDKDVSKAGEKQEVKDHQESQIENAETIKKDLTKKASSETPIIENKQPTEELKNSTSSQSNDTKNATPQSTQANQPQKPLNADLIVKEDIKDNELPSQKEVSESNEMSKGIPEEICKKPEINSAYPLSKNTNEANREVAIEERKDSKNEGESMYESEIRKDAKKDINPITNNISVPDNKGTEKEAQVESSIYETPKTSIPKNRESYINQSQANQDNPIATKEKNDQPMQINPTSNSSIPQNKPLLLKDNEHDEKVKMQENENSTIEIKGKLQDESKTDDLFVNTTSIILSPQLLVADKIGKDDNSGCSLNQDKIIEIVDAKQPSVLAKENDKIDEQETSLSRKEENENKKNENQKENSLDAQISVKSEDNGIKNIIAKEEIKENPIINTETKEDTSSNLANEKTIPNLDSNAPSCVAVDIVGPKEKVNSPKNIQIDEQESSSEKKELQKDDSKKDKNELFNKVPSAREQVKPEDDKKEELAAKNTTLDKKPEPNNLFLNLLTIPKPNNEERDKIPLVSKISGLSSADPTPTFKKDMPNQQSINQNNSNIAQIVNAKFKNEPIIAFGDTSKSPQSKSNIEQEPNTPSFTLLSQDNGKNLGIVEESQSVYFGKEPEAEDEEINERNNGLKEDKLEQKNKEKIIKMFKQLKSQLTQCADCPNPILKTCFKKCLKCQKKLCNECEIPCCGCPQISCKACSNNCVCSGCLQNLCSKCQLSCNYCDKITCDVCKIVCSKCKKIYCAKCKSVQSCTICNSQNCIKCSKQCTNCQSMVCNTFCKKLCQGCESVYCQKCANYCKICDWEINLSDIDSTMRDNLSLSRNNKSIGIINKMQEGKNIMTGNTIFSKGIYNYQIILEDIQPNSTDLVFGICKMEDYQESKKQENHSISKNLLGISATGYGISEIFAGQRHWLTPGMIINVRVDKRNNKINFKGTGIDIGADLQEDASYIPIFIRSSGGLKLTVHHTFSFK